MIGIDKKKQAANANDSVFDLFFSILTGPLTRSDNAVGTRNSDDEFFFTVTFNSYRSTFFAAMDAV